jgi:hypothetical protein
MMTPTQKAFCEAVLHYDADDWSPALPGFPRVPLQGKSYSLREVCDFVKTDDEKLPEDIATMLFKAMHSNPRQAEKLGRAATYAVGSECFAEILDAGMRRFEQQQRQ